MAADGCMDFRSLLQQKEMEILGTHERQVLLLQQRISEQGNEYSALERTFSQLQEDFKYNLALLDSRDMELEEYDALLASIEGSLKEKELALEELGSAILKARAENMQERERDKLCKDSMNHKICDLVKELGNLRIESEGKLRKQENLFESIKSDLKRQILESEEKVYQVKKIESDHLRNLEKQIQVAQWESDSLNAKLHNIEVKFLKFESNFKISIDEQSRKLQDLCLEIRKLGIEEDHLRQCYDDNLKTMQHDASVVEKEQTKCISQEIEKVNQLIIQLNFVQSSFDGFKNTMMERLLTFSGKVQCLEQEVKDLKDYEIKKVQKIESQYMKAMQHQELCLQEAKQEALNWRGEFDHKQKMCIDLEKRLLQVTNLEAENRHLQESLLELKDQNQRIQKVVATLRLEMESLQDATAEENQRIHNDGSEKETEMQTAKDFQEELQVLKSKISNMSLKLDGIQVNAPATRKTISNVRRNTGVTHKADAPSSDEDMSSRLADLEQTQMILKAQLEATLANAARIADERDILMELNNSLHADLNRTIQCSCANQHHHSIEDKRNLDGVCCHETSCLERRTGQNNAMQCCSSWSRCNEVGAHKECCNNVLVNINKHSISEQKATVSANKLLVEGNMAKYHGRISASEDVTHKGTVSQQANLKYLVRRHEPVQSSKPKVRNYNIKDDDMHKQSCTTKGF